MSPYFGVTEAIIDHAAASNEQILPPPGVGFEWRVLGYMIVAKGAVDVTLTSGVAGATPRTGVLGLAAGQEVSPGMCTPGDGARWFSGGDNEEIGITLAGAVQVGGQLVAEKVIAGS